MSFQKFLRIYVLCSFVVRNIRSKTLYYSDFSFGSYWFIISVRGYLSGVSVWGVFVEGGLCQGRGSLAGGSLSRGVSVEGSLSGERVSVRGVSVWVLCLGRGLCPGRGLCAGVPVLGGFFWGVSVQGGLCQGDPPTTVWLHAADTHSTGLHSCFYMLLQSGLGFFNDCIICFHKFGGHFNCLQFICTMQSYNREIIQGTDKPENSHPLS